MTKQKKIFTSEIRNKQTSNSSLRLEKKLPANVYGLKQPSQTITLDSTLFAKHLLSEGDSGLIYVEVGGVEVPVLIDETQRHPVTGELLHVTLQRVNLKEKIVAAVPLEMINENEIKEAIVLLTRQEVEVEALPSDLPDQITVDASSLTEVGAELHWDAVDFDRQKVKIMLSEEEMQQPLVLVQAVQEEKEPEVVEEVVEGEGGEEATSDQAGDVAPAQSTPSESASE